MSRTRLSASLRAARTIYRSDCPSPRRLAGGSSTSDCICKGVSLCQRRGLLRERYFRRVKQGRLPSLPSSLIKLPLTPAVPSYAAPCATPPSTTPRLPPPGPPSAIFPYRLCRLPNGILRDRPSGLAYTHPYTPFRPATGTFPGLPSSPAPTPPRSCYRCSIHTDPAHAVRCPQNRPSRSCRRPNAALPVRSFAREPNPQCKPTRLLAFRCRSPQESPTSNPRCKCYRPRKCTHPCPLASPGPTAPGTSPRLEKSTFRPLRTVLLQIYPRRVIRLCLIICPPPLAPLSLSVQRSSRLATRQVPLKITHSLRLCKRRAVIAKAVRPSSNQSEGRTSGNWGAGTKSQVVLVQARSKSPQLMILLLLNPAHNALTHRIYTERIPGYNASLSLLPNEYFCLFRQTTRTINEPGIFIPLEVTGIPEGHASLVLTTKGPFDMMGVARAQSPRQVLEKAQDMSYFALTSGQSQMNLKPGYSSPVCKRYNTGPSASWDYYPVELSLYSCPEDLVNVSKLQILAKIKDCTPSTQANKVFLWTALPLASLLLATFI